MANVLGAYDPVIYALRLLADRLALGRRVYGALDLGADSRDLRREALAEAADLSIYLAMVLCR